MFRERSLSSGVGVIIGERTVTEERGDLAAKGKQLMIVAKCKIKSCCNRGMKQITNGEHSSAHVTKG